MNNRCTPQRIYGEVHWLESKFGSVVDAYEAKDKSLKTDALIEYWEEVDFPLLLKPSMCYLRLYLARYLWCESRH